MPIQPLNVSSPYSQIPDEDITPVENSIAKKVRKSFKSIAVIVGCCVVIPGILIYTVRYTSSAFKHTVQIVQTSFENGDRLKLLSATDLGERGFPLDTIAFGNVKCSKNNGDSTTASSCTTSTSTPATVEVDSKKKFQEIVGFGGAFTESSAYNFYKLPVAAREKVRRSLLIRDIEIKRRYAVRIITWMS